MKQKRKVKSLLSSKIAGSNKLSILLFTVSGVLCMFAMILFSAGKVSFAAPLQYTGVNDNNQVVYEVTLMDPIDYSTDVHSMYVTGGSVYITPKPVIVNLEKNGVIPHDDDFSNRVLNSVYGNILGGISNSISSDNVTIIAGEGNEVNAGNENATILGGEGNTLATNGGEEGVMVGGKGNEINSNGLVVGGEGNTVNTSSSRILGGEGNTVNANNAIVGGKNVEGNAENAFVYSSDGSYYEANAGGTFYLGVENGLGINTDGNTKGLSVGGSLGEGEINVSDPAQKCDSNNIGMQGMYQGCLVGCTSESAVAGKWEMIDQGEECRKKEQGREQSNDNIMQSPKLQEEKLLEALPAGKCSEGTVNTWQSTICGTPASYKGMIFETTLVDHGKCPSNTDKLINNQCAYQCEPGSNLTGDTTNHYSLNNLRGEGDRRKIIGCFKNCSLDGQEVKHNAKIIGYNVSSVKCSNDSYRFPMDTRLPAIGNGSYETCGNYNGYIHKKTLICIDGTLYLDEDRSKVARNVEYAGYIYKSCTLGGYDCKTDASNYNLPESTVTSSAWEGKTLNGASTWGDDRKEVKGTKGTYELCISYNAPTAVNGETCTKESFNYKLKKCNPGYYWKSDSEGCQLCEAGYYCPGEAGKSPRYEVSNGYYAIAGQDHQTQCPAGYRDGTVHANKVSEASCLRNMPAGYYMASGKSTSNTECANGYYKTAHTVTYGATSSCTICPAGYRNGTALANKTAENVCLKNVAAGYYVGSAHAAETVCANGYYRTAHTVTYGATSSCTICPAGYRDGTVLANKTAENVCLKNVSCGKYVPTAKGAETNCPVGYFRADAHTVTYGATSSCTKASAGSYVGSAGQCAQTACGCGKWSNAGASACSNINAGCYGTSATSACPAACGAGKWSNAQWCECSKISCGCYGTSGGNSCPAKCAAATSSAAGTYSSEGASACTTESRNGYYVASAGACGPSVCPAGYYCPSGKIIACPAGSYTSTTTQSSCTKCVAATSSAAGTYQGSTGKTSCTTETRNGYYVASAGATGPSVCPAGYYCPSGKIIACPAGSYTSTTTQSSCTKCVASTSSAAGTYQGSTGKTSCTTETRNGYYVASAGATGPSSCPAGYYCPAGKIIQCPAGYYCPAGSSTYTQCPCGSYCPAGSGSPIPCGGGKWSNAGSSSCNNIDASCYGTSACSSCPASCPTGQYSNAAWSSCSGCTNKPANSSYTSNSSSNSCSWNCNAGYYRNSNSTACIQCEASYYCAGNQYRYPCGVGQYSNAGWSSCSNCTGKPSNSHFTTNGTNNNCNWACDSGYCQYSASCLTSRSVSCLQCGKPSNSHYTNSTTTIYCSNGSWTSASCCNWACDSGYHQESSNCILNCTTTAKSANGSAIAIGNKGSCAYGYEDPDTCGYDNSCDCYGNRTWDGVICKACSDSCPSGYSKSKPSGCYDTTSTQCGSTCYKSKTCPCTTTAKSANSSAIAIGNKGNCSCGYEDPDTCGYDNSCDCYGNRTWDGVICKACSSCSAKGGCSAASHGSTCTAYKTTTSDNCASMSITTTCKNGTWDPDPSIYTQNHCSKPTSTVSCSTYSYSRGPCKSGWSSKLVTSEPPDWKVYNCTKDGVTCTVYVCKKSNCLFYSGKCHEKDSSHVTGVSSKQC